MHVVNLTPVFEVILSIIKKCVSNYLKALATGLSSLRSLKSTFLWHSTHATYKECYLFYS